MNSADEIETVTVNTDNGPVRINKSEYDPTVHVLADPVVAAPVVEPTKIDPTNGGAPAQRLVAKIGKKFVVVDGAGAPIVADGIDPEGYASEADAWKAAAPQLAG